MRRARLILALLLASAASAVRISAPSGEQPLGTDEPLTLVFGLHNDAAVRWQGTPTVDLPAGWNVLFPPEEVELAPGEDTALLLPVSAPSTVRAGTYAVKVRGPDFQATAVVRVPERRRVEVRELPGEGTVLDGRVQASFMVRNAGNVPEPLDFSVDMENLTLSPGRLTLASGEQATVVVTGTLPPRQHAAYRFTFKVLGRGGLAQTLRANRTALLSELPLDERALTLRGQLEFGVGAALEPRLSLQGRLSPDLPGTVHLSVAENHWNVRYQEQTLGFGVGSLVHGGLRLQPGVPLVGIGGNVTRQGWRATAAAGLHEGAFAGGVTLGYIGGQAGLSVGASTSARGTTLAADATIKGERLQGWASGALDLASGAPRLEAGVSYQDRTTALTASVHSRAPDFAGQARGDLTLKATARQQLRPGVTGTLSGVYSLDPSVPGAAPAFSVTGRLSIRTGVWSTSLGMTGLQVTDAGLGYQNARWNGSVAWTEETLSARGTAAVPVGPVTLRPTLGATLNLRTAQVQPVFGVQARWEAERRNVTLGFLSPTTTNGPWNVTASATLPVSQAALTLSGNMTLGSGSSRTRFRASLSRPLEIVTARREDVGTLEGRLQYPDGRPLAGVRVRAGRLTTTTDTDGRYTFPDVPQGAVDFDVVDRDAAAGLRARPSLPLRVEVRGGQVSTANVRFSPGATLQGRLLLAWPDAQAVAGQLVVPEAPDLASLILRLTGPEFSYETTLNTEGTFTLSGMQPGTYEAVLFLSGKTLLTTAHLKTTTVRVSETGTVPITLELLPVTQDLQIEDGGELTVK